MTSCATCRFWAGREEGAATIKVFGGGCRKHAPDLYVSHHKQTHAAWPLTRPDDWCGDFEHFANSAEDRA